MKLSAWFWAAVVAILANAAPVAAESAVDGVVRQLRDQGYERFVIKRSALGRTTIQATKGNVRREVVLSSSGRTLGTVSSNRSGDTGSLGQFGKGKQERQQLRESEGSTHD